MVDNLIFVQDAQDHPDHAELCNLINIESRNMKKNMIVTSFNFSNALDTTEDLLALSSSQSLSLENFVNFTDTALAAEIQLPEHWNKFPTMEIVETSSEFDMHINPDEENQNWRYNSNTNKVFIKLYSVMTATVSYKPQYDGAEMFLRAMILYTCPDDMHLAVKRCANHRISKVQAGGVPKEHILKCCVPHSQYVGHEEAQTFGDRLSILVPLGRPTINEDGRAVQPISLEFLCQNSCTTGINRRSTAVVFTLENQHREILGKSVMPFKVCSCPKRDMFNEVGTRKRDLKQFANGKRPSKMTCLEQVKSEPPTPSPVPSFEAFIHTPHTVTLTMPTKESMQHVLRCGFNEIAGMILKDKGCNHNKYLKYAEDIERLLGSLTNKYS